MDLGERGRGAPLLPAWDGYGWGRRSLQKGSEMPELNRDEQEIVEVVRDFVNREVKPVVRDLEHSNAYPDKLITIMKELGVYGLAIPGPWGDGAVSTPCYALITEELARGWM